MTAKFIQPGSAIDYTNSGTAAITYGSVVAFGSDHIGVAASDIAVGATGALHLDGVFALAKDSAEIALGAAVYYDAESDAVTATSGGTAAGHCVAAAAAADSTVLVRLNW